MIEHQHKVAGEPVSIKVVETEEDLDGFRDFIEANQRWPLGLDSETTGLDIYGSSFRCRLAQFGTHTESWVLPVELGSVFEEAVRRALREVPKFVLHNASYDLQVFDRCLGVPMEEMWPKVTDTKIITHLVDPRAKDEGGYGHSLEELVRHYVDADVADNVKTLMKDLAKAHKTTTANVWKKVPFEDPHYQLYSGMDPILAVRLLMETHEGVPTPSLPLISYEHKLAEVCSIMERTGFLLDEEYTRKLSEKLLFLENQYTETALRYGAEDFKVNSTEHVADVIESFGVKIAARTASGQKRKVDDALLNKLVEGDNPQLAEFAKAIIGAKKAGKWRKTWVDGFLAGMDSEGRCHASINPLRARTARMSITGIPAQTLPAGDSMIRRCFIADPGQRIASVDYAAQELRVLAALSKDPTMIQAFRDNADLHLMTAQAAFGKHITKDSKERKWAKVVNFGRVYGGGAATVAEQTGLDFPTAKRVVDGFDRAYPGVQRLSSKLQQEATAKGSIQTPTGRVLPVDPTRAYRALNYLIQSTSRDVTGRALVRLHESGFTPYLRLPIHDEVLASVPEEKANWGANKIAEIMAEQMGPVHIATDAEVGGRSWGSLYGADY
jgi:DNA polymerase-1